MANYTLPAATAVARSNQMDRAFLAPLRPVVIGPRAGLHRYAVAGEKAALGTYDPLADTTYAYTDKTDGSTVDLASVKVYADAADLNYFNKYIGVGGVCQPSATYPNRVRAANFVFKTANGTARSAVLYDRDVKVGDIAVVRGTVDGDQYVHETVVTGFVGEPVAAVTGSATGDAANETTQVQSESISQVAGTPVNDVVAVADGAAYESSADGYITRTYTITVTQSSTDGDATTGLLRVRSSDGLDDQDDVVPAAFSSPTDIGTKGLTVTWSIDSGNSSSVEFDENDFVVGQAWEVTVSQAFTAPTATAAGTYTGTRDDNYIVTVTRGGAYADATQPQITVTTANGSDSSGPTTVTASATAIDVGSYDVTIAFNQTHLRKGDVYYIAVTAAAEGEIRTLKLQDDVPDDMLATEVDLRLFARRTGLELPKNRTLPAEAANWSADADGVTLEAGIYLTDSEFTDGDDLVPLPLETADLYVEYREWLAAGSATVVTVANRADVAALLGTVAADNPLAYAVDKALTNTYGALVEDANDPGEDSTDVVLAVSIAGDPADAALWTTALEAVEGNDQAYSLVLLSTDPAVQALGVAHVDAQSETSAGFYRRLLVPGVLDEIGVVVSAATTADELVATATIAATPAITPTRYTTVTGSANALFVTSGVRAGDKFRINYATDVDGVETYDEYTVASVTSETKLILTSGPAAAISVARRAEVWRTYTKAELVTQLTGKAAEYAGHDGRVMYVWPDEASFGGVAVSGPDVCAIVAGLAGSVPSHQGLRNVTVSGVDDVTRARGLFTDAHLGQLAAGGVFVVSQLPDGTPYVRAAVTTDVGSIETREEMIVRNADMIRKAIQGAWAPYVGAGNVVSNLRVLLEAALQSLVGTLKSASYAEGLGSPVASLTLTSIEVVEGSPDQVAVTVTPTGLAVPLNAIRLTLSVVV